MLTFWRSAFEEWIWGPYSSSRGIRQKRSYSISPASYKRCQSSSEVYPNVNIDQVCQTSIWLTENTPENTSPRAMPMALWLVSQIVILIIHVQHTQSKSLHLSMYGVYILWQCNKWHLEANQFSHRFCCKAMPPTGQDETSFSVRIVYLDWFPVHGINASKFEHDIKDGRLSYISPGFVALGPGIFSVKGVDTTRLIL